MLRGCLFAMLVYFTPSVFCFWDFRKRSVVINPSGSGRYHYASNYNKIDNAWYNFLNSLLSILCYLLLIVFIVSFLIWMFQPKYLTDKLLYLFTKFGNAPEYTNEELINNNTACFDLVGTNKQHCVISENKITYYGFEEQPVTIYLCKQLNSAEATDFQDDIYDDIIEILIGDHTRSDKSVRESVTYYIKRSLIKKLNENYHGALEVGKEIKYKDLMSKWIAQIINNNISGAEEIKKITSNLNYY